MTRGILFLLFFAGLHVAVSSAQESFTAGRSFAVCFMNNEDLDKPNAFFRLFMIGSRSATGTARWGNEQVQFAVEPGKVTTVDIPLWLALTRPGVVENKGILIECSDTVVVYGLNHNPAAFPFTSAITHWKGGFSCDICLCKSRAVTFTLCSSRS